MKKRVTSVQYKKLKGVSNVKHNSKETNEEENVVN